MSEVRVAIIGLGYWGKNLFRALSQVKNAKIVCACDLDEKNLQHAKTIVPGCRTTSRHEEVFTAADVDAVVIATPMETHYGVAKAALEHKKHCFVEKPLSTDVREAEDLVHLAKKNSRLLFVGHLLKHHPVTQHLKKMIDNDDLGEIHYVYTQRLNLGIIRSSENTLWSLSPHDISLILYFLNDTPTNGYATGGTFLQKDIEDVVFAGLFFKSGHIAHMHLSWLDPHKIRKITIVGSKKMAVFDDMQPQEKLRIYDKGAVKNSNPDMHVEFHTVREGDIYIPKIDIREPLVLECQNFVNSVLEKEKPRSDGEEALAILCVIDLLHRSLKSNGKMISY